MATAIQKALFYSPNDQGTGSIGFSPDNLAPQSGANQVRKLQTTDELAAAFRDYYSNQLYSAYDAQQKLNQGIDSLGNVGGYYSRIPQSVRQNAVQKVNALGGITPEQITGANVLDLIGKTGWSGGLSSDLQDWAKGISSPSGQIQMSPEEARASGVDPTGNSGGYYSSDIVAKTREEKANIASGALVPIGTSPTGKPLYASKGSPATRNTNSGYSLPMNAGETTEQYMARVGQGNLQAEKDRINAEANKKASEELARISTETSKVDLSKSSELVKKLNDMLSTPPPAGTSGQSLQQQFVDQRKKLGVDALETELSGLDAKIAKLDADYASATEGEEGRLVSMTQVRRRQSAEGVQYNRARRDIVVERDSVARQVNTKLGIVEAMVKYAGMDIENAQQNYQTQFTQAIAMANLMKGIDDSAKADAERKADNARANVQIMANLITAGNVDPAKMDASSLANVRLMEMQAGFDSGLTQFIAKTIKEPVVTISAAYTNAAGERAVQVYTRNPTTGGLDIKTVTSPGGVQATAGAGGTTSGGLTYTREQVAAATKALEDSRGSDNHVNSAVYLQAWNDWKTGGGLLKDFLAKFPPKLYTNPSDTSLPEYLRPKADSDDLAAQIDAMNFGDN